MKANLKKVLMDCLKQGGEVVRRGFRRPFAVRNKGPVNIVTDVDIAAENKVVSIIRKNFPDHRILTEESPPKQGASEYRWIIDPIDGTSNFAHGINICCLSIAVEKAGKLILGGIFNPLQGELYFAERGRGAALNGRRIRVSRTSKLIEGLLVTGFPYDRQTHSADYLKYVQAMLEESHGIRRLGAAALDLAFVACGRLDAFWEFHLKPWDIAAGVLIVEEAGGRVTDLQNGTINLDNPSELLASNGKLHNPILTSFGQIPTPLTRPYSNTK